MKHLLLPTTLLLLTGCAEVRQRAADTFPRASRPTGATNHAAGLPTRPEPSAPSGAEIEAAVDAAREEIRECAQKGSTGGSSKVKAILSSTGAVVSAEIVDASLRDSQAGQCALGVLRDIRVIPFCGEARTLAFDITIDPPKPEPPKPPEKAEKAGNGLYPREIQRVVRENFDVFRGCYQAGLMRDPRLEGRVNTHFVIDLEGRVTQVTTTGSTLHDVRVRSCVRRGLRGLTFPKPEGGVVTVTYPIMFSPVG